MKQLVFTFVLVLLGCSDNSDLRWTEDVQLPDGRIVTLRRVQQFDERGYVAAHSFEFEHPVTKQKVRWKSDAASHASASPQAATWQKRPTEGFFTLVALFWVHDEPYILIQPTFGGENEAAGCPFPSMFIYRHDGEKWQQIPYAKSPVRRVENNTTMDPKDERQYIISHKFRLAAGEIHVKSHPTDGHYFGLDLEKYPIQVFQCSAQRRFDFQ